MNAPAVIEAARADGVALAIGPNGALRVSGPRHAVDRWAPAMKAQKPAIFEFLLTVTPASSEEVEERTAIAIELGRVPPAYANAWAAFQTRKPPQVSWGDWYRAMDDAGRFLDAWAELALDFGWQSPDIFGPDGLAWFCAGERVRALGPDNAVTASGLIFMRQRNRQREN